MPGLSWTPLFGLLPFANFALRPLLLIHRDCDYGGVSEFCESF